MDPLTKIAFVLADFKTGGPAQQLLDRFLLGYPHDGKFVPGTAKVAVTLPANTPDALDERAKTNRLAVGSLPEVLKDADAVMVIPKDEGAGGDDELLEAALMAAPANSRCFVYGSLASSPGNARQQIVLARRRAIELLAGSPLAVTWRLPAHELPQGAGITDALIVVPDAPPVAEFHGLEGLMPLLERRRGGEAGVRAFERFSGQKVWDLVAADDRIASLLPSALSRSHSPLGDPVRDGRTQDLFGLGLLPKLVKEPRAWRLHHHDGLRTSVLSLPGAVADINLALRLRDGKFFSAQLYRPPPPAAHSFSRLAAVIAEFFRTGNRPWPLERNLFQTSIWQVCRDLTEDTRRPLKNPDERIAYQLARSSTP